jgi:hypothetical protein
VSRWRALVGAAALGAVIPLVAMPAAVAAEETGSALISLDGTSFERSVQGGIFPAGTMLIPGGTATGTFYVMNDSDRAADLRIAVAGASSASATFLDELSLQAGTPATRDAAPVPLSSDGACIPLLSGELIRSGQVTAVHLNLTMDADATDPDQGAAADAALVVSLTDPATPDSVEFDCTDGGGIPLLPALDQPERASSDATVTTVDAPQPTAAPRPEDEEPNETGVATPAAETPPTAGALPLVPAEFPVPLSWLGTGGLALGAVGYLVMRLRKRHAD